MERLYEIFECVNGSLTATGVRLELPRHTISAPPNEDIRQVESILEHYDSYRHLLEREPTLIQPLDRVFNDNWRNEVDFFVPRGWQQVTLVHLAAHRGDLDMLKRAVALYATFKSNKIENPLLNKDKLGRCSLHYAASKGHSNVVSWILEQVGPNQLSLQDEDVFGRTPLHDAVGSLHADVVKVLVDAGASVNVPNKKGVPPYLPEDSDEVLDKVIYGLEFLDSNDLLRYEKIVKIFVENSVNVNHQHPKHSTGRFTDGWTMLYYAVFMNSFNATKILLQNGAHVQLRSIVREDWRYVLVFALESCNDNCIPALVVHGGDNLLPSKDWKVHHRLIAHLLDHDGITLLKHLLDARILPNKDEKDTVTLDYQILSPPGEPEKGLVSILTTSMKWTDQRMTLQHPLLQAYIGRQWMQFSKLFISSVIIYAVFVLFLFSYTIHLVTNNYDPPWLRWFMLFAACSVFCHNLLQFLATMNWQFVFDNGLLFLSLAISAAVAVNGEFIPNTSRSWVPQALSVAISIAGIQLTQFLGRFPGWGYYVLLMINVMKHVLKVLLSGSLIIVSFTLSFFILFHDSAQFNNPWKLCSKTVLMMTGKYKYGDLFTATSGIDSKDNSNSGYMMDNSFPSVISRIVLITFLIIAGIVLINLMVGLAVSDIPVLVNEGHLVRLLKQAEFIVHCERMTTNRFFRSGRVPTCLKKWVGSTMDDKQDKIGRTQEPPPHIPEEIREAIYSICKERRDRDQKSQSTKSDSKQVSLATLQASLEMIESRIQQLIQDRNANMQQAFPGCIKSAKNAGSS